MSELLQGPLEDRHRELGASFAEFGGWLMPVSYAGTVAEHTATREAVGLFDVSHLGKARVTGGDAVDRLHGLVDELHGWAEAERTAWVHARSVTRLLDGRVDGLAGLA